MAPFPCTRPFGPLALAFLAVAAAGCQTTHPTTTAETTGGVGLGSSLPAGAPRARAARRDTPGGVELPSPPPAGAPRDGAPRRELAAAGALYRADPGNPDAAIRYAAALRAIGESVPGSA